MLEDLNIVAIIPARGGSKGIPKKNIADLGGKPLIAYSIQAALKSKLIKRVLVSTDDQTIASVAKEYGAEVPKLRPKNISGDKALVGKAIDFILAYLKQENYKVQINVVLYPTHPFRTPKLIDFLLFKALQGFRRVITVKKINLTRRNNYFQMTRDNTLIPLKADYAGQFTNNWYRPYGLFSAANFYCPLFADYYHILSDPISLIDIDTPADLYLARKIIRNNLFIP